MRFVVFCFCALIILNNYGRDIIINADDLYAILGISKSASQLDIRRAYRNKARETHPDKSAGEDKELATIKFRAIVDAYEVLSDDISRKEYDRTGSQSQSRSNPERNRGGFGDWDFRSYFYQSNNFNQQQQKRRYHRYFYDPYIRPQVRY